MMPRFLLVLVLLPTLAQAGERKVVAERAGCSISVGDRDAAGLDLIVADCRWPIATDKVVAAVKSPEKHSFLSSVKESRKLADGRIVQVHSASGIADRQITLTFADSPLPDGGFKTSWTRASAQEPLGEDNVDCPVDDGSWEVHPDGQGGSTVVYSLRYDVGGKVPTWLVRGFQKGGIADLVEEMRAVAAK
jgi:hypothetical protein